MVALVAATACSPLVFRAAETNTTASFSWPKPDRSSARSTATAFFPVGPGISRVAISRVVVSGRYAVATFEHGRIEGDNASGQLLLERFAFGWQTIGLELGRLSNETLRSYGIVPGRAPTLLGGALATNAMGSRGPLCDADFGDSRAVAAVRRTFLKTTHQAIAQVRVEGNYAVAAWWGNGGGEDFFVRRAGAWRRAGGGGGAFDSAYLVEKGVPRGIAVKLMARQVRCG